MNLLMKRVGANVTLPIMVVLWGIVCTCQGAIFRCTAIGQLALTAQLRCRPFLSWSSHMSILPWRC